MVELLQSGTRLVLPRYGGAWRVGTLVGEGGEGAVFELRPAEGANGTPLALKWYFPEAAHPAKLRAVTRLAQLPPPSEAFLWPIEVVEMPDGGFGYVMPLRPDGFVPIADLLTGRVDSSFSAVVRLCMGLADSFLKLHAQGLCYRDISLGNAFFEPETGRPLVCDNDNVGVDGREPARVLGTSRFMAPEVVSGEAQPSTATDLFSLAVLIFYLLMIHHPLQGRRELSFPCFDRDAERQLFGTDPLFIFDPHDDSNAPDPAIHGAVLAYWPLYPEYIRADFTKAFTVGLREPGQRVREGVWRSHLSRLLDGIVVCSCGRQNFTDDGTPVGPCWSCHSAIPSPVRLRIANRVLVLSVGTKVTRHHVLRDYAYDVVLGEVVAHPTRPGVWGLRNMTQRPWHVISAGGSPREVAGGQSLGLVLGTTIDFGTATGVLEG